MAEPALPVFAIDDERAARDIGYFLENLRVFLDYGELDRRRVLSSATLILPHSRELLDGVYTRLLAFSWTRRFFVGPDGRPNQAFLEKRRKTLFEWLAHTAAGQLDGRLGLYLEEIAAVHLRPAEPGCPSVPLADILLLYGVLQIELGRILATVIPDADELLVTVAAWTKMLTAQQAVFARVYQAAGVPLP